MLRRLLSTKEVAELLEVSPATVARWAREGKLVGIVMPSGRRKFDRAEVERLLVPSLGEEGKDDPV